MPPVTRWFIKSGMIYFILGIATAFIAELPVDTGIILLPVYWHMLVLGWITQIIMGVSIWMFPRRKRNRRNVQTLPVVLSFWMINAGLVLRFLSEPFIPLFPNSRWMSIVVIVSSILLLTSIVLYLVEIWPRVYSRKRKKGKRS